jgi:hypothetical protein
MVIALVALSLAMAGTGIAASRYLVTSTSQIKPSVLRELRVQAAHAAAIKLAASGAHAVRTRARSVGPITTPTGVTSARSDPLSGATWTQHAEELNQLTGQVTVSGPGSKCEGYGQIRVRVDGELLGSAGFSTGETTTEALEVSWMEPREPRASLLQSVWLWEPPSAVTHTLTAEAWDDCEEPGVHYTINSVSIDVLGLK